MDRPENGERPSDQPEPVDDLQRIWGVGPKIAHALTTAGITTFAALASAESDRLRTTLQDGGIRIVDLEPWRQQAALAAAGNFDALEVLQEQLKARRRSPQ
jgi:predicted flap endonuclease-1-like 5' DNA nuclease